jgi:eukaryotic-like serine/threonine-protein kinase
MGEARIDETLGERYRLIRHIASGGMGTVWEAEDTVLHRRVAVKLLSEALASEPRFADRFRREALAAAGLSHPSVASVYDYGENGGPPFIVMELVEGETLSHRIRREGRLPEEEALRIAVAIAAALQAAHSAGIVHRDVKPGNVMLTPSGEVRVLDFGISAAAGAPLTATGARMGTATYLSPEQARGEPPTPASDVYSLGVVLYEMLGGRPPFAADNPVAVAAMHMDRPPVPITDLVPDISPAIAATLDRTLAKDPSLRPASAADFASMLTGRAPVEGPTPPEDTVTLPGPEPTAVLAPPSGPAAPPSRTAGGRHPSRTPIWVVGLVSVAAALITLFVLLALSGGSPKEPPLPSSPSTAADTVEVPNVAGLEKGDAEKAIREAGLEVGDVVTVEGEKDVAVRTDPPAGSRVARGSTVTLYVGSQPKDKGKGHGNGNGEGGD